MFFNEANFKINEMNLIEMYDKNFEYNNDNDNDRNLLGIFGKNKKLRWSKTISLPVDSYEETHILYYTPESKKRTNEQIKLAECTPVIEPYASATVGFAIRYTYKDVFSKPKIKEISGKLGFEFGVDATLTCQFGEETEDGTIDIEIFSYEKKFNKYKGTIGPIVLTTQPYVNIGAVITRPALTVTLTATANIGASVEIVAGWKRSQGGFATFDHELITDFDFPAPTFPGSDGRLAAQFAIVVTPGLRFGIYGTDALYVAIPISLPYIRAELSDIGGSCGGGFDITNFNFEIELGIGVTVEVGVEKIKLFDITVYKGTSWTPEDPLFELELLTIEHNYDCKDKTNVISNDVEIYSHSFDQFTYNDYPYILVSAAGTDADGFLTTEQANAYCSLHYDSGLATIKTANEYYQVEDLLEYARTQSSEAIYFATIGLYDDDHDGTFNWLSDGSTHNAPLFDTNCPAGGYSANYPTEPCSCASVQDFWDGINAYYVHICSARDNFICDLYNITNVVDRHIGVYLYDTFLTFDEANDWCNDTYGTELATILTQTQNNNAYQTILNIMSQHSHVSIHESWIGIDNIVSSTNFSFQDGRDYTDNEYSNWDTSEQEPEIGLGDGSYFDFEINNNKQWFNTYKSSKFNSLICNRPNLYNVIKYDNYIGLESENFGLMFEEANQICQDEFGTQLASIHTSDELNSINSLISQLDTDSSEDFVWIGLTDDDEYSSEGNFIWLDGTTYNLNDANWLSGQPNNAGGNQDCGGLVTSESNQWADFPCEDTYKLFVCNRDKTIFEYNDYIGINTHNNDDSSLTYTWNEAEFYCNAHYGTNLASVHSSSQEEDIDYVFEEIDGEKTWIGLNDIATEGTFVWSDGSPFDYNDWYTGPDNYNNQDCVIIWRAGGDINWDDGGCSGERTSFVCNRPISTVETDNFIGVHLRNIDSMDWNDANNYCINTYDTKLASILNSDQNTESLEIYDSFNQINIWIGIHDTGSEGTFIWEDGNTVSYTYWATGEPNDYNTSEDCGHLWTRYDGPWNDQKCDNKISAFICNKPIQTYEDEDYVGVKLFNNGFYTFDEADNYCTTNYDTNHLVSHCNTAETFQTMQRIMNAIDTTRAYIGLKDITNSNTYEWLAGDGGVSIDDPYWNDGEPNSNNGDCVEMWYLHNGQTGFNDISCSFEMNTFVCNNKYYVYRDDSYIGVQTFKSNNEKFTFDQAENYCLTHFGTHLASVNNENNYDQLISVYEKLADYQGWSTYTIIGLHDPNNDGNFEWIDGSVYNYTSTFENSYQSNDDCVSLGQNAHTNGKWKYNSCGNDRPAFICNAY